VGKQESIGNADRGLHPPTPRMGYQVGRV